VICPIDEHYALKTGNEEEENDHRPQAMTSSSRFITDDV